MTRVMMAHLVHRYQVLGVLGEVQAPLYLPSKTLSSSEVSGCSSISRVVVDLGKEMALEDQSAARTELANSRKLDRKEQKERLDELASRAAPGTRERQLEKKRELNEKMRSFRDKSPGAVEEIKESDLMGDDGIDAYKVKKKEFERKKNERELRKEEVLRVRSVSAFQSL